MKLLKWLDDVRNRVMTNIGQRKLQQAAERSRAQRFTKLSCEGLEDRRVLAAPMITDQWVGGFSSDWNNPGNWLTKQNRLYQN